MHDPRPSLIRAAGVAGMVGGVAVAVAYGLHPPDASPEVVASAGWVWIHVLFLVSLISGVFLLQGLIFLTVTAGEFFVSNSVRLERAAEAEQPGDASPTTELPAGAT